MTYPKLSDMDIQDITVQNLSILYKNKRFIAKSGLVQCLNGLNTFKTEFRISPSFYGKIQELNNVIGSYHQNYKEPDIKYVEGFYNITINCSPFTKIFDNNKVSISSESQLVQNQFMGYLLLDLSLSEYNDTVYLRINPLQILIRTYSSLPAGCIIYYSIKDLIKNEFNSIENPQIGDPDQDEEPEPETEHEPELEPEPIMLLQDLNELLD